MSNFITLDQYRAMLKRNVLSEPQMLVSNQTQPLGQISFQCPGDNFQLKDILIPASRNAVDLTQFAPLDNLLACSQLKALLQTHKLRLLNPEEMPEPSEDIPQPSLSKPPVAGTLSVDGTTIPNAIVIVEQEGNVWTGVSNSSGVFNVNVSGLKEGSFVITVTADGYAPARYTFTAGPSPLVPMPEPTVVAIFKETTVSGTTVADANVVVHVGDTPYTGQANAQGQFSVTVAPLPFIDIVVEFTAEGYVTKTVTVSVEGINGLAQINAVEYLAKAVSGKASPNAEVEILIDGQANQFATANADGEWSAVVPAIKGNVAIRSLAVDGYKEATANIVPTKLAFGAITIDNADAFGENSTVVSGSTADLNVDATDIAVIVTVQAGVFEGTVNLAAGTFNITGVDAKTGVGAQGVVTVSSAFYEEGTASFQILEEFAAPTLQQATDGQTAVVGDTLPSTSVKITMAGETKTASSNPQGAFSVGGFTNVVPGQIAIELTKPNYLTHSFDVTLVVKAYGELDADPAVGVETIAGQATPGSTVTLTQGSVVGDAVADASSGDFTVTLSGPLVAGELQLKVQHANYVDYTETFTVA